MQVGWSGAEYRMIHAGVTLGVRVLTPRQAELAALMPEKQAPDLSKYLLSPMPGLLLTVEVEEGREVKAVQLHVVLADAQLLAGGDADHLLDELEAGEEFGHGVLDLEPGVNPQDVEVPGWVQLETPRAGGA